MISKPALVPALTYLGAAIVVVYFSCKVLANKENEKEGLVILSLSLGNTRRDLFGSVQSIAGQATQLVPDITSVAGGVASQVTAAVSAVISDAAALETSVVGQIFAANYTVGTKYACAASSCDQIPSLEVVLCFGLFITVISAITFALTFFMPFMKLFTIGFSMLATLFFIVFAACVISIAEVASLVAGSTFFHVEKGSVFAESLWALGGAIVLAFSAIGMLFVSPRQASKPVAADQPQGSSRVVPTWARGPAQRSGVASETTNTDTVSRKESGELTGSTIAPSSEKESEMTDRSFSEKESRESTGRTIAPSFRSKGSNRSMRTSTSRSFSEKATR